jgi:hypothetical protein
MLRHEAALVSGKLTRVSLGGQPTYRKSLCLGATPIEPQRNNSHVALQACLEVAFIEPTNYVGLVEVFGTLTHKGKLS